MYANYHTHTARCMHAQGEDREYVEAAIEAGIQKLGFSDHCPWIYEDDFVSTIRMLPSQLDSYFDSLLALKKEYAKDITIHIGFEAENIPSLRKKQEELLSSYPVDYMILGQHFVGLETDPYSGSPTQDESILKGYVDLILDGMDTGNYLYVAHPDLINYTGDPAIYEKHMTHLCQYLKDHEIPVEINMLGAYQGRNYPCDRFLTIAKKVGNSAIVGADAHVPDFLKNNHVYTVCANLAKQYDLPLITDLEDLILKN